MSDDNEQPVMWASTLMLLCKKVYERHQTAVIVPSVGNLAIRENSADNARFLGVINLTTCTLTWRDE